jgi:hypothetical protein
MGQIGAASKEGRVRHDSRRYDPEGSSSGFPKSDTSKGVSTPNLTLEHQNYLSISLTNGASVCLTGILTSSPGPGQHRELVAEAVEILGACDPEVHKIVT